MATSCIDTHLHLDLLPQAQRLIAEARTGGVDVWVVPGVAPEGWERLMAAVAACPGAYAAPGIHPQAADRWQPLLRETLLELGARPESVAIGEVGLDRRVATDREVQELVLVEMIGIARELALPLLLHCREATGRLLEILRREEASRVGGIFHGFSGSIETALQLAEMGFALGIGGVLTYPGARRLPETLRQVPEELLVLESDAPDMAPHPHRGEVNRPAHLLLVAEELATLRGWSLEQTLEITTGNACRVLRLPQPSAGQGTK